MITEKAISRVLISMMRQKDRLSDRQRRQMFMGS